MAHDIFISYSNKDKQIADAICANIERAGIRCWIAPRDIAPGEDWPAAISNAITASRGMVLVFSSHSNSSDDVSRELMLAASSKIIIIPFKIDNVEPEPGLKYYLARTHWLDAVNPPTQEQIDELVETLKKLFTDEKTAGATVMPVSLPSLPHQETRPAKSRKIKPWMLAVGLTSLALFGLIVCGGAFLLGRKLHVTDLFAGAPSPTSLLAPSETRLPSPNPRPSPTVQSAASSTQPSGEVPSATKVAVEITRIAYYETSIRSLAWFPDNKQIVLAGFELQPYDVASQTSTSPISQRILEDVAISPDGKVIAIATTWEGIKLLDRNWGSLVTLSMSSDGQSIVFTPDGKTLLAGVGHLVKFWDVGSGEELRSIPFSDRVNAVAISPDGKTLAVSSMMEVKLMSMDGNELFTLQGHGHQIFAITFSSDGSTLATGSLDKTIRLWNVANGRLLRILYGHTGTVNSVAFSPDGLLLASGSDDTMAKVWEVASGTELQTLYDHTESVYSVAFSPDGTMLATGSFDKMQLWNVAYKNR
jgi:WD40 repeat protein